MAGGAFWGARNWTTEDKQRFADHADLEAIAAELAAVRAERKRVDERAAWLEALMMRRAREVADGIWPPAPEGGAGQ